MLNCKNAQVVERLVKAYKSIMQRVGDPLDEGTLYGPLHTQQSVQAYLTTLEVQLFVASIRCRNERGIYL
jgi:acyl-CoA reductase-like NAD-dependent aldehyde dehydrogenase